MKKGILLYLFFMWKVFVSGQEVKRELAPMHTGVPSLSIVPDAKGSGMGDNGLATEPDVFAQYYNPAKYAFHPDKGGVGLSYTPWLRKLVNDIALLYLSGYVKPGAGDNQAIGFSVRYFTLGKVNVYPSQNAMGEYAIYPYEIALDMSYSRRLTGHFSLGVAFRYIRSDMGTNPEEEMLPGNAFSTDIAGYFEKYIFIGASESLFSLGFALTNIGTRISYDGGTTNEFLPAALGLGSGILYPIAADHFLGVYLDLNKYLVPTLPAPETDQWAEKQEKYNSMSSLSGMFRSFTDAPGGFREELKEIMVSLGAEYSFDRKLFLRGGYFYENRYKGNRQYLSVGGGFHTNAIRLDIAYLVSPVRNNPLDQTLRLSVAFHIHGMKSLVNKSR